MRNCRQPVDKSLYGFLDFFTGMEEYIVDYRVFQPVSQFPNLIQTGIVRRKKYQFQTVSVFFQEFFQQFFNELFLFLGIYLTQCISRSDITESQTLEKIEQSSGTERYSESLFHKCACGGAVQLAKIPTSASCGVFVEITVRSCVIFLNIVERKVKN